MSDDLFDRFVVEPQERNPLRSAQRESRRPLVRRFYAAVSLVDTDAGFAVGLDGKHVRTPRQRPLLLSTRAAGEAVASEWSRQGETIDPGDMVMTRIVHAALDGVVDHRSEVEAEIVRFAASDLVCYRASAPEGLVTLEAAAWDPVLAWARDRLGADLVVASGIVHARQPDAALLALGRAVGEIDGPVALACLHTMTTLCGSALLALAVARKFITVQKAWDAAHVDEDYQTRVWGADDEAAARKAYRWREMNAAAKLLAALEC